MTGSPGLIANVSFLRPEVGGSAIYTVELLRRLAHRTGSVALYGPSAATAATLAGLDHLAVLTPPMASRAARYSHQLGRLIAEVIEARRTTALRDAAVIWSPGNSAVVMPRGWAGRQVVTVHDLIHRSEVNPLSAQQTRQREALIRLSMRVGDHFAVPSSVVAHELITHYTIDERRITVTGEGVDLNNRRSYDGSLPEAFLFCPATDHPHKNHELLFRAAVNAGLNDSETHLVMSGVRYGQDLRDRAHRAGLRPERVIDLGLLPHHGLILDLMARSRGVVLPSKYEGWGLPIFESLALGVPTIAHAVGGAVDSRRPGLMIPRFNDPIEWANAIRRLLDGDSQWERDARDDAVHVQKHYSWDAVADRLTATFDR